MGYDSHSTLNRVFLIGRLGNPVELKYLPSGMAVANFSLATTQQGKDKQDITTWHKIIVFDKQGEFCERSLKKGGRCHVEGYIQNRSWQDKEGMKRYITEIVATKVSPIDWAEKTDSEISEPEYNTPEPPEANDSDDLPF